MQKWCKGGDALHPSVAGRGKENGIEASWIFAREEGVHKASSLHVSAQLRAHQVCVVQHCKCAAGKCDQVYRDGTYLKTWPELVNCSWDRCTFRLVCSHCIDLFFYKKRGAHQSSESRTPCQYTTDINVTCTPLPLPPRGRVAEEHAAHQSIQHQDAKMNRRKKWF